MVFRRLDTILADLLSHPERLRVAAMEAARTDAEAVASGALEIRAADPEGPAAGAGIKGVGGGTPDPAGHWERIRREPKPGTGRRQGNNRPTRSSHEWTVSPPKPGQFPRLAAV